jgi:hypothetical protein
LIQINVQNHACSLRRRPVRERRCAGTPFGSQCSLSLCFGGFFAI